MSATGTAPPHTARVLALMHTAMYDAWAMYSTTPTPYGLSQTLRRPVDEHTRPNRRNAIVYAAYRVLHAHFYLALIAAGQELILQNALDELGLEYKDFELNPRTAEGLGNLAGQAAIDRGSGDGSNMWNTMGGNAPFADYTNYQPSLLPDQVPQPHQWGEWQPLRVPRPDSSETIVQQFLVPHWGALKPFAMRDGAEFRPHIGPDRDKASLERECAPLIEISEQLTDQQKAIAEYWSDGPHSVTPPGHWCMLAAWLCEQDKYDTEKALYLFFILANALYDASIAAWDAKRHFNYVRPVTAIRHIYKGRNITAWGGHEHGGVQDMPGEAWHPY
ncbi:MAG: DUF6851 domain-containing protein, partial [Bacteroidota bacterium]